MKCLVCHQEGGISACSCPSRLHVGCLAKLIENNYGRCQNCFAEYKAEAVLAAARHMCKEEPTVERFLVLCMKTREAGLVSEASRLLNAFPSENLSGEPARLLHSIEYGACLVQQGSYSRALHLLRDASRDALGLPFQDRVSAYIRARCFYAQALIGVSSFSHAEGLLVDLLRLTPKMTAKEVIMVMRCIGCSFRAQNKRDLYRKTVSTIAYIVNEDKDPVAKAAIQAELGIAEHDCGLDSSVRIRAALISLRKRGAAHVIKSAVECLGKQVMPSRRLRRKTRIECV